MRAPRRRGAQRPLEPVVKLNRSVQLRGRVFVVLVGTGSVRLWEKSWRAIWRRERVELEEVVFWLRIPRLNRLRRHAAACFVSGWHTEKPFGGFGEKWASAAADLVLSGSRVDRNHLF